MTAFPSSRHRPCTARAQTPWRSGGPWARRRWSPTRLSVPSQPTEWCIWRVELLDLFDARAPGQPGKAADQLDVAEVAGRKRVGSTAAIETEAPYGPGADLRHREKSPIAGLRGEVATPAGDLTGHCAQGIARRSANPIDSSSAGARPAIAAGPERRAIPRAPAQPCSPAADDTALDPRRELGLDQLLDHSPGERLPGPGATVTRKWRVRRSRGPSKGSARKR